MHITIINDCHDDNAGGRQLARTASLTGASVSLVGVGDYGDLSAAGNLIDVLDAYRASREVSAILVNVAPRHKGSKKWQNGTPFCHFKVGNTLVVSSFDGLTLSLIKKLGLVKEVFLMDIPTVTEAMVKDGAITNDERNRIISSQFRSFDFTPLALAYLLKGNTVPAETSSINDIPQAPKAIWWIDNFGNAKTTVLPEEIGFKEGEKIQTALGVFICYEHLATVPKGESALIIGSSGINQHRFVEIVVQGGSAKDRFDLSIGTEL